ncbi:MAG: hypothetical protein HFJ41_04085 [Clostridia bacterium]|nr:hypothetical protein [Clostridia bacterium]
MTIKEELKEQLKQAKAKQSETERDLEAEAKVMIEEFLIPKFREIAKTYPLNSLLYVDFNSNIGCWYYTSNIDGLEGRKKSSYDYKVVSKAIDIANEYDIEAKTTDDGAGGTWLKFSLKLDE